MKKGIRIGIAAIIFSVYFISGMVCFAGIYSYTDEDGVIHFVDSPDQIPKISYPKQPINKNKNNIANELQLSFPPENKIEEARNATVKLETHGSHASGFFVSQHGYILTNKHVVMGIKEDLKDKENELENKDKYLSELWSILSKQKKIFDNEEKWLSFRLELIRKLANEPGNDKLYNTRLAEYTIRKTQYDNNIHEYRKWDQLYEEKKYESDLLKDEIRKMRSMAYSGSGVDVFLVNGRELHAYVKATSDEYDLALLKLSKTFTTPVLKRGNVYQMETGMTVYSIGNPLNVGHSVSSGIISGIKKQIDKNNDHKVYIQTTAQMSPGSSGGPLIDQYGRVLGINTWGKRGAGAEGLNFAIPIDIAMKEFKRYLR